MKTSSIGVLVVVGVMVAPTRAASACPNEGPAVVHLSTIVRHHVADAVDGVAQLRVRHARVSKPDGAQEPSIDPLLAALGDGELLEAAIDVPLERLKQLQPDALLRLYDNDGALVAESPLSRVLPDFEGRTMTARLESVVDNSARHLHPGQAVRARVILHFDKALTVPAQAVVRIGGRAFVMVAESRGSQLVVRRRAVLLGSLTDGGYVVRGGVEPGEKIVSRAPRKLDDGASVLAP